MNFLELLSCYELVLFPQTIIVFNICSILAIDYSTNSIFHFIFQTTQFHIDQLCLADVVIC